MPLCTCFQGWAATNGQLAHLQAVDRLPRLASVQHEAVCQTADHAAVQALQSMPPELHLKSAEGMHPAGVLPVPVDLGVPPDELVFCVAIYSRVGKLQQVSRLAVVLCAEGRPLLHAPGCRLNICSFLGCQAPPPLPACSVTSYTRAHRAAAPSPRPSPTQMAS